MPRPREPRKSARERGYDSRWRKARAQYLAAHRLCAVCLAQGVTTAAAVVDHIRPHRGDMNLFWDRSNWQPLCRRCHDSVKRLEEAAELRDQSRAYSSEIGLDGWPVDERHPAISGRLPKRYGWSIPDGLEPSAVPVVLVCGPPGAGKTTHARERARPGDLVIDFDDCLEAVGGVRWDRRQALRKRAMARRDRLIRSLSTRADGVAFLIVMAPTAAERAAWIEALGRGDTRVIATPADECRRRILTDPARADAREELLAAVDRWWFAFEGEGGSNP